MQSASHALLEVHARLLPILHVQLAQALLDQECVPILPPVTFSQVSIQAKSHVQLENLVSPGKLHAVSVQLERAALLLTLQLHL